MSRIDMLDTTGRAAISRDLIEPRLVLGRGDDADWRFDDPTVSRAHAAVFHLADHDEIEDLESRSGTRINGAPLHGRATLRHGDRIQIAAVRLAYDAGQPDAPTEQVVGDDTVSFHLGDQTAHTISNVGRDQIQNQHYLQQIIVHREDALQSIDMTNRTAHRFQMVGMSLAAGGVLSAIGSGVYQVTHSSQVVLDDPEKGPEAMQLVSVLGIPVLAIGMAVFLIGMACVVTAAVIETSAKRRRREVEQRYPLPPGWGPRPGDTP